jgi:general secretion pathway protein I
MLEFWTVTSTRGFTLIEVLVALTILSLSLGIIFSVFSVGLRGKRAAEDYETATLLAESRLNSIGIDEPIREGETVGQFDDRFWWKTVVTPYHEEGRDETKDLLRRPVLVTIAVSWGEAGSEKSVTLRTLRLVPAIAATHR